MLNFGVWAVHQVQEITCKRSFFLENSYFKNHVLRKWKFLLFFLFVLSIRYNWVFMIFSYARYAHQGSQWWYENSQLKWMRSLEIWKDVSMTPVTSQIMVHKLLKVVLFCSSKSGATYWPKWERTAKARLRFEPGCHFLVSYKLSL